MQKSMTLNGQNAYSVTDTQKVIYYGCKVWLMLVILNCYITLATLDFGFIGMNNLYYCLLNFNCDQIGQLEKALFQSMPQLHQSAVPFQCKYIFSSDFVINSVIIKPLSQSVIEVCSEVYFCNNIHFDFKCLVFLYCFRS